MKEIISAKYTPSKTGILLKPNTLTKKFILGRDRQLGPTNNESIVAVRSSQL